MGLKSRGNYNIPICLRADCINHGIDVICKKCFKFSEYDPFPKKDFTDAYKQPLRLDAPTDK